MFYIFLLVFSLALTPFVHISAKFVCHVTRVCLCPLNYDNPSPVNSLGNAGVFHLPAPLVAHSSLLNMQMGWKHLSLAL